jgi:biofilm protein TabA
MFTATLFNRHHWTKFIHEPVFQQSLDWISKHAGIALEGIHEMGEPGWYVNVHGYETLPREDCKWENHPGTIDIQYIVSGVEAIDVAAVESLGEPLVFLPEIDTHHYAPNGKPFTRLILEAGSFVVFLPGEAHRPKIAVTASSKLAKLVVKIPIRLIGSETSGLA